MRMNADNIIVCHTIDTLIIPKKGSVIEKCCTCKKEVWKMPSSPDLNIYCYNCAQKEIYKDGIAVLASETESNMRQAIELLLKKNS